jgi:hypothetical protein
MKRLILLTTLLVGVATASQAHVSFGFSIPFPSITIGPGAGYCAPGPVYAPYSYAPYGYPAYGYPYGYSYGPSVVIGAPYYGYGYGGYYGRPYYGHYGYRGGYGYYGHGHGYYGGRGYYGGHGYAHGGYHH